MEEILTLAQKLKDLCKTEDVPCLIMVQTDPDTIRVSAWSTPENPAAGILAQAITEVTGID